MRRPDSSHSPLRMASGAAAGVFLFFHGTMAPGDEPLSERPMDGPHFSTQTHGLLAAVSQLGYAVIAPDDLGIWRDPSGTEFGETPPQAYLNHAILAKVAIEMLRSCMEALMSSPGLMLPGARPQLWLMGGSHGGYIAAAVQRRIQMDTALSSQFRLTGSFVRRTAGRLGTYAEPHARPTAVPKALVSPSGGSLAQVYAAHTSFAPHVRSDLRPIYDSNLTRRSAAELSGLGCPRPRSAC